MSNAQLSYFRLLIGDNAASPTYADAQLTKAAKMPPASNTLPAAVAFVGLLAFERFPVA